MQPDQRYALLRPCWEDLWTARDGGGYPEAAPSHSSHAQVENSTASQPGDAVLLAQGRMGPVYRRTLQGFDAVVKTLSLNVALNGRGERVHPRKLRREMRVEVRAYAKLAGLTVLPRLLWQGEFVDGIADALITEYAGEPLALTNLNEARTHGALQALEAIHLRGVLHGAIALSNFVAVGDTVKVVGLSHAQFRGCLKDAKWAFKTNEERDELLDALGDFGIDAMLELDEPTGA